MKTVLCIEDESILQETITNALQSNGYGTLKAHDGEEGLMLAREKKPDLILLDLILPKRNGFDILADLKQTESTKHIPVIILTNLEGVDEVEKAIAGGATTYLVKANYSLEEVLQKIRETIG